MVTGKLVKDLPKEKRRWVLLGCVLPDYLYHTYIVGHTYQNAFDRISKKMLGMKKCGRDNWMSYLMLGYIFHYVEDFYTLAHNQVFQGNLRSHISYERQLEEFLKEEEWLPKEENTQVMPLVDTIQYLKEAHRAYLKRAGGFGTDIEYIYSSLQVVSNCLLRVLAENERKSRFLERNGKQKEEKLCY